LPYFRRPAKQFIRSLHRRDEELPEFFSQAAARLNPGGAIIISYSSLADLGELRDAAGNNGFSYRIVKAKPLIFETLYVIELRQSEKARSRLKIH
jgi:hypothetical protein